MPLSGWFHSIQRNSEPLEASGDSQFKDISFIFMGHGGMTDAGKNLERKMVSMSEAHANIHHIQSVPMKELLAYTSSATIGCVLTVDNCLNHKYSLPNKFFNAMAGLPMLVSTFLRCVSWLKSMNVV